MLLLLLLLLPLCCCCCAAAAAAVARLGLDVETQPHVVTLLSRAGCLLKQGALRETRHLANITAVSNNRN